MAELSLLYPGVEIIDLTTPTEVITPYGVCYLLLSAKKGKTKTLTNISSLEQFGLIFGLDSPSYKYVESFFKNRLNAEVRLFVYRVNINQGDPPSIPGGNSNINPTPFSRGFSSGYGNGTQTANPIPQAPVLNDWLEALRSIDPTVNPGGIIICPEAFETLNLSNRGAIVGAMTEYCDLSKGSYWQAIADLTPTILNLSEAVTDVNGYSSVEGAVSLYQPFYFNNLDVLLLPSAAMAAISLSIWASGEYYIAPAGLAYPIKDCDRLGYVVSSKDYGTAHAEGINLIRYQVGNGYIPYDCVTISSAEEYLQIPSVVCFKITAYLLQTGLLPLVFGSLRGQADLIADAEGTINRILFGAWQAGYLVGQTVDEAYEVVNLTNELPKPSDATLTYEVGVRPAYSNFKYKIYLRNLLAIS